LALHQGIAAFDPDTHALNILCDPEPHLPQNRFNDGKCDPAGRLWAGTMNLEPSQNLTGALYSFDRRMKATKHLSHVGVSNGLAWSTDAKIMYYIDSMSRTIDSFDYDLASGEIANRRVVFNVPTELGVADGMTIDAEDNLWVAFWGGWCVAQVDPIKKEVLRKVKLPVANVTSCTFGGQQLDELYITTARHGLSTDQLADQLHAGDLFVARPGICGLPSSPFPG
jgi:sugar lactone lactonase YvrE